MPKVDANVQKILDEINAGKAKKPVTAAQAELCVGAAERVVNKAAEQLGLRPRQVARRFRRGKPKDAEITAAVLTYAAGEAVQIDPDNLRAILDIILEFIKALMSIFT